MARLLAATGRVDTGHTLPGTGKVKQVVTAIITETSVATTSNTMIKVVNASDEANWEKDITISDGNKVFCMMSGSMKFYHTHETGIFNWGAMGGASGIIRDTTQIYGNTATNPNSIYFEYNGIADGEATGWTFPFTMAVLDTPGSGVTNPTYYCAYAEWSTRGAPQILAAHPLYITLMEIQV